MTIKIESPTQLSVQDIANFARLRTRSSRRLLQTVGLVFVLLTIANLCFPRSYLLSVTGNSPLFVPLPPAPRFPEHFVHGSRVPGTESVFLMVKTGATVLWKRLPVHLNVTFPQVENYAIYSDAPDSFAGIPVIDTLANVSERLRLSDAFITYRQQQGILRERPEIGAEELAAVVKDAWWLDRFKNLPMLAHAYRTKPNAKWYIFIDGDTFVFWTRLMRWLNTLNPDDVLYMGSRATTGDEDFAHGGSGVVLSNGLMRKVFGRWRTPIEYEYDDFSIADCCGDHVLAHALLEEGIPLSHGPGYPHVRKRFQGEPPSLVYLSPKDWCEEIVTFHHLTPQETTELYDFEAQFGPTEPILYKDVYNRFVMPHIKPGRKGNWDNGSSGKKYTPPTENDGVQTEVGETAYTSHAECRKKCDSDPECLQFKYKKDCCILSDTIRLGQADLSGGDAFSSEWNIGKIRAMRKDSGCDRLYDVDEEEGSFYID
ncbi:hypothetical protein BZA70DRAFT_63401 [Myxozyma melibiosi]|uniref:N-acetylgalactosaminide beta-1,3-galactosyltransferase n=1 Tax=Myxozyma melibiosi TaxID=54550 RepID=A0ABR1F203_9ASCO